jgi:hypothetical protein
VRTVRRCSRCTSSSPTIYHGAALLWLAGGVLWFVALATARRRHAIVCAVLSAVVHYARRRARHPQARGVGLQGRRPTPASSRTTSAPTSAPRRSATWRSIPRSYLHFAPGQSDNAAFNLKNMPANAYLGLYLDSEGPSGIIKDLPAGETPYFRYLPMFYPYVLKQEPETFVVQFGGGIRRRWR